MSKARKTMAAMLALLLCAGTALGEGTQATAQADTPLQQALESETAAQTDPLSEPTEDKTEMRIGEETSPETSAEAKQDENAAANTGNATEAPDITAACEIKLCSTPCNTTMITDQQYTTYWDSYKIRNPWVVIHSETPMYGLYLCFRRMPESFELQIPGMEEGEWTPLRQGDTRFQHTFYPLEGLHDLRIQSTQTGTHKMGFNEIFVFGQGEIPDWVQRWEPTEEKADILFFSAHPDDELLFYGGAIATYAAEKRKRVVVAYLSYSNTTRRSEALNGLWTLGVRHYPEFGGFADVWSNKLSAAYDKAGKKKVLTWVTEMYRKHQPEVVVTHDLNGEYGHGQHKMMADAAIRCYELAADPAEDPASASAYGTWQVRKLYVHLWGDESSQTRFDWHVPLESMGGKTGLELAEEAYALHVTQASAKVKIGGKWHLLSVEETGTAFSNTTFGLYASQVGPDESHTDFLEHIE